MILAAGRFERMSAISDAPPHTLGLRRVAATVHLFPNSPAEVVAGADDRSCGNGYRSG